MSRTSPVARVRIGRVCTLGLVLSCVAARASCRAANAAGARRARRDAAAGGRRALQGPRQERHARRLRGLAPPGRGAGQGSRLAHDPRGEGGAYGRPVPPDGPGRHAERATRLRRESVQRRTRGARLAGDDRRPPQAPHRPVHQPREPGAADDGEVAERRSGAGGGTPAGHAGAVRDESAQPLRRSGQLRDRGGLECFLAVARDARPRRHAGHCARGGVRPDRRAGVRLRGDPRRVPPDRGRGDRAALGTLPRDLRRGCRAHRRADRRRDTRIPGTGARPAERRAHDQALSRGGSGERAGRTRTSRGARTRSTRAGSSSTTCCRGRRRSRPARR